MNGSEEDHSPRNRPLSGGIWTFFSWLRRSERSSSESISSVGSDRSVASFDFLGPTEYVTSKPPLTISTNDPTDTYNKRLYDREIRRRRDHDMTIHRKYGLLRFEGYDSLPVKRSNLHSRQQRATSECYQRRTPYVPGKRRAPLPPTTAAAVTLPRYKRKRPAPKPPNVSQIDKENLVQGKIMQTGNISEVNSDLQSTSCRTNKDKIFRDNKSFLKQIFDNRKSMNIDTSHVKFLPSISELDKQALEIIERKKALKHTMGETSHLSSSSENPWICTKCLRKYQSSVEFCLHCQIKDDSKQDNSSNRQSRLNFKISEEGTEKSTGEKEKLKLMLKEMKKSLPKKSVQKEASKITESSTLRIGDNIMNNQHATTSNILVINTNHKTKELNPIPEIPKAVSEHSDTMSQPVFLKSVQIQSPHSKTVKEIELPASSNTNIIPNNSEAHKSVGCNVSNSSILQNNLNKNCIKNGPHQTRPEKPSAITNDKNVNSYNIIGAEFNENIKTNINAAASAPLKISSLLSPLTEESNQEENTRNISIPIVSPEKLKPVSKKQLTDSSLIQHLPSTSSSLLLEAGQMNKANYRGQNDDRKAIFNNKSSKTILSTDVNVKPVNRNLEILSHHSRRRNLVSQLEQSISKGDVKTAAEAAAELAKLRLSCSVLSFSSQIVADSPTVPASNISISISSNTANAVKTDKTQPEPSLRPHITKVDKSNKIMTSGSKDISIKETKSKSVEIAKTETVQPETSKLINIVQDEGLLTLKVWIEDKETARGPVSVNIGRRAIMEDLMQHADKHLGLPIHLQRWIVGKHLCTDNKTPLSALAGKDFSAPFYLCLVQPESKESTKKKISRIQDEKEIPGTSSKDTCSDVYKELINLEKEAIVPSSEPFECEVCMEACGRGDGVVLRECIHIFCKRCVADAIKHCQEPIVACPAFNCSGTLQEREIRALLNSDEYERWLARGLVTAESGTRNTFHCRTADCNGWAFCEQGVRRFPCPVCKHTNCIPCQVIHEGDTCEEYKEKLKKAVSLAEKNQIDEGTRSFLDSLIQRGEALACPECNTIITKKWGCDWIKCSACKTEICWITKGRRWGPGGKGDTSGGCRCGIDGKRCHPTCSYCH